MIWWYIGYRMSIKRDDSDVTIPLTDNEDPDD